MLTLFLRAAIIYLLVFAVIRLSGKRQLSQLQPFDLVITLLIADLASIPMADPAIPLAYGVVPITALFLIQKFIAFISLKSEKIRNIACGKPLIIIDKGHVCENIMRQASYSMQDLLEHLRTMSVFDISDVHYAILETNGDLSILLNNDASPLTCKDMNINNPNTGLSYALIIDGKIIDRAVSDAGVNEKWLRKKLKSVGISECHKVFYAILNSEKILNIRLKDNFGAKEYVIKCEGMK